MYFTDVNRKNIHMNLIINSKEKNLTSFSTSSEYYEKGYIVFRIN